MSQQQRANNKNQKKKQKFLARLRLALASAPVAIKALVGFLLAASVPYLMYKYGDAAELRAKVYQPIYSEIAVMEEALRANTMEKPATAIALDSLKRSGQFDRVPRRLRERITRAYAEAEAVQGEVPYLAEKIERLISAKLLQMRSKESDALWMANALQTINAQEKAKGGISSYVSFEFKHAARGPGVSTRPNAGGTNEISYPAGPTWQINDWLAFPGSVEVVEPLWRETDYLFLDDVRDSWFYKVTRKDLRDNGLDMKGFLEPMHHSLSDDPHFKHLAFAEPKAIALVQEVKTEVGSRVDEPKRLLDLWP